MSTEPITGLTYQNANSLQTDALQNAELNYYGAWLNCVVLSIGETTPPVSPTNGDRHIVGSGATGPWAGHGDDLTVWRDGWQFSSPIEGVTIRNLDDASDWIFEGSGGWAVKAGGGGGVPEAPIDGQQYARKDAGWVAVSGGGGDVERIGQVLVSGSAVTDIDFSGVDLDADKSYRMEVYVVPGATGAHLLGLYYNSDTTATNYRSQLGYAFGTSASGAAYNNAEIHFNSAMPDTTNAYVVTIEIMKVSGSKPCATSRGISLHTDGTPFASYHAHRRDNTANVTDIKLRNSISGGFGVGTLVRLYRMN